MNTAKVIYKICFGIALIEEKKKYHHENYIFIYMTALSEYYDYVCIFLARRKY